MYVVGDWIEGNVGNLSFWLLWISKATMDHMYLIGHNFDDGSINLADPTVLAAETSQKNNLNFGRAMKAVDCEDFMKAIRKERKDLTTEDVW